MFLNYLARSRFVQIIKYKLLIFIFLNLCNLSSMVAQKKDSMAVYNRDSLALYKKIKKAAYKYEITKWAYNAIFVDPEPREYPVQPVVTKEEKHVNPYLKSRGCVIRKINIKVLDPFGYSVNDTTPRKINMSQKAGNNLHITTRRFIIQNRLLFKQNDSLDALRISESERLLREASFVNDAKIFTTKTSSPDSVDVNVIVHDKWPIVMPVLITDKNGNARFRNKNLLGSGQQFEQYMGYSRTTNVFNFNGFYLIPNIDNTYISSQIGYQTNPDETSAYIIFDKPFYSFLATWAGGLSFNHSWSKYQTITDTVEMTSYKSPLNLLGSDVWLAKSFKLSDKRTLLNQSTNLITGLHYYNNSFLARPSSDVDTARSYRNNEALIGNIGVAVQQYYKDRFIYRFGANEDVPEGLIVQFIYGGYKRELSKVRYYNGVEVARAKHFNFGYLSATFSYGIFYNTNVPNDVTTNYKLYYFSELLKKGRWYFRQFFNYKLVHGENKMANEKITIGYDELYGFSSGDLKGNTKMILNSETVAYMPYNLIGFRFAPILMVGLGMLGDPQSPMIQSRLYQAYSLGIMIRNENLLTSTFQFSIGMYPFLPDGRNYTIVVNPVTSFTLKVRAFSVTRPDFVAY
jgi:hypothetical protein